MGRKLQDLSFILKIDEELMKVCFLSNRKVVMDETKIESDGTCL